MKTKFLFKRASLFVAMIVAAGSGFVSVANAQDGERLQLEEITVTARKRDESIQDAPYTITALTAADIEVKGINELQDIVSFSPGFFYSENAVGKNSRESRRLIFRGMNPRTDLMHRQAASVFIDGAPTIGPEFGSIESVERIEVLKGPQGAHFGRSTYTGALNIITKDPGSEFSGRVDVTSGQHGLSRHAITLDGPITESIGYRLSASSYETGGQYDNAAVAGQKLGARSTDDFALTLVFNPTDNLSAKLRYHTWKDSDGPDAATALDYRSGYTNCQPGAMVNRLAYDPINGLSHPVVPLDYICGKVPMPSAAHIGMDTGSPRALAMLQSHTDGTFPLWNGVRSTPDLIAPDHFGLERDAQEVSLNVDYDFDNGMNLNVIYAAHENSYGSHNDLDRRATENLDLAGQGGAIWGSFWANHPADAQDLRMQAMEDSSWEVRLSSSDDQRLRWTVGYSDIEMNNMSQIIGTMFGYTHRNDGANGDPIRTGNEVMTAAATTDADGNEVAAVYGNVPLCNAWGADRCGWYGEQTSNASNTQWATINTSAVYATLTYDVTDKLSLSAEVRRQKDEVNEGSYNNGSTVEVRNASGEFTSTLPRFIADFKPNEDTTIYVSYAEGTLPGLFNPSLIGLTSSQLAEIAAQTGGADVEVGEEVAENWEIGLKRSFLDGRGFISAAYYTTDLTNVHIPSVASYTDVDENGDSIQVLTGNVTSQGGNAELNGLELEGTLLLNENLTLGFTYALNDSELGNKFLSGDASDLLGDSTLSQGNEFSRYPKTSGSVSLDFNKDVAAGEFFARADLIYTGKMYASNAMLAHTGTGQRINFRTGLDTDTYRLELFCTNCFEDEQPKGLQAMWDLSGISGEMGDGVTTAAGPRILAMSLPDKRVIGVRASVKF
jgi:iron complex outermembrane receptor protein